MSKLLAAMVAVMFAFGTTTAVLAAEKEAKKEATPKVDCKDPKNKDNKACMKKDDKKK